MRIAAAVERIRAITCVYRNALVSHRRFVKIIKVETVEDHVTIWFPGCLGAKSSAMTQLRNAVIDISNGGAVDKAGKVLAIISARLPAERFHHRQIAQNTIRGDEVYQTDIVTAVGQLRRA